MTELPLELVEVIWFNPGICPNCRSKRRGDGRSHDIRTRAGIECEHLDGRIIDLRKRRDRQLAIGDESGQENGGHRQGRGDRPQNKEAGWVHELASFSRLVSWGRAAPGSRLSEARRAGPDFDLGSFSQFLCPIDDDEVVRQPDPFDRTSPLHE